VNCGGAKSTRCFASRRPPSSATSDRMHLVRMAKYSSLIARKRGLSSASRRDRAGRTDARHRKDRHSGPDPAEPGKARRRGPALMRPHARIGYDMLKDSSSGTCRCRGDRARPSREVRRDRLSHRLERRSHPARARIVAIADVYERADLGAAPTSRVAVGTRSSTWRNRPASISIAARGIPGAEPRRSQSRSASGSPDQLVSSGHEVSWRRSRRLQPVRPRLRGGRHRVRTGDRPAGGGGASGPIPTAGSIHRLQVHGRADLLFSGGLVCYLIFASAIFSWIRLLPHLRRHAAPVSHSDIKHGHLLPVQHW